MRAFPLVVLSRRGPVLLSVAVLIVLVAVLDWHTAARIPLGFLYLAPMALAGCYLDAREVAIAAVATTFLTEQFDSFPWSVRFGVPRDILYFAAFAGMGFLMYELARRRKLSVRHMLELQGQIGARRDAEEQLQILVGSSPAGILIVDGDGRIQLANQAAERLFGTRRDELRGLAVREFLPSLVNVPASQSARLPFRTAMQCQGRRADGEVFQADVWFSTYSTSAGPRLAAMVLDISEDLRTREEASLHQVLAGSRILLSAVTHEVRNVCGAIAMVHENLTRGGRLAGNKDFETLGTLVLALERIAAKGPRQFSIQAAGIDAAALLEELRIIIEPALREEDVESRWLVEKDLPPVWADRQSLMQVFLNLVKNSERAMQKVGEKRLLIEARREGSMIAIRFTDTGGGVAHPELLFRPFQAEADETGLGLYLSRAFMRDFRGDLRYEPAAMGSSFVVVLTSVERQDEDDRTSIAIGRRSQSVSREPEPAARNRA